MLTQARSIGWGLYGAVAWTWCIGMYLPVLLLQWYGWPGFWLIAIPNVIGCTAMALIMRSKAQSEAFCQRNTTLMRWFAVATIGFQVLFMSIVGQVLMPDGNPLITNGLTISLLAFAGAWLLAMLPRGWWPWMAAAVWIGSMLLLVDRFPEGFDKLGWTGERAPRDVLWYAPIFILGFLICPWLDAPFHRMVQSAPGRLTAIVMGTSFLAMLFVTASYWQLRPNTLLPLIGAHLMTQVTFTMAANLRELGPKGIIGGRNGFTLVLPLLAIALPWLNEHVAPTLWDGALQSYLRYIGLYGIVFPAIALFVSFGQRQSSASGSRIAILCVALLVACALAEPSLVRAGPAWLSTVAVAVVLAAWILSRSRSTNAIHSTA